MFCPLVTRCSRRRRDLPRNTQVKERKLIDYTKRRGKISREMHSREIERQSTSESSMRKLGCSEISNHSNSNEEAKRFRLLDLSSTCTLLQTFDISDHDGHNDRQHKDDDLIDFFLKVPRGKRRLPKSDLRERFQDQPNQRISVIQSILSSQTRRHSRTRQSVKFLHR